MPAAPAFKKEQRQKKINKKIKSQKIIFNYWNGIRMKNKNNNKLFFHLPALPVYGVPPKPD
tara:strand:+ start:596 stop:778 length:183 start_codon:yes stop_codon:yes gene_type:complete